MWLLWIACLTFCVSAPALHIILTISGNRTWWSAYTSATHSRLDECCLFWHVSLHLSLMLSSDRCYQHLMCFCWTDVQFDVFFWAVISVRACCLWIYLTGWYLGMLSALDVFVEHMGKYHVLPLSVVVIECLNCLNSACIKTQLNRRFNGSVDTVG